MPNLKDDAVARSRTGSGATSRTGYTEEQQRLVHKQRNDQMGLGKARGSSGAIACKADEAPTILASQLVLRNLTVTKAAQKCGISETRLSKIAAGALKPDPLEASSLEKAFHEPADVLVLENTAPNRAKLRVF